MNVPIDRLQLKIEEMKHAKINWDSYLQGQMIKKDGYEFLIEFDQLDADHKAQFIMKTGMAGFEKLISIINLMAKEQTVGYLLTRLDSIIEKISPIIEKYALAQNIMPWTPFTTLLNRQDRFIAHMSARLVSKVTANSFNSGNVMEGETLNFYFGWLRSQLTASTPDYLQSTVACLQRLMKLDYYRVEFFNFDGLTCLMPLMTNTYGFQLQYQISFCLWMMTYNPEISKRMDDYQKIIVLMSDILKDSQKEKVLRMIVATFVNLIKNAKDDTKLLRKFTLTMVTAKVPRSLELIIQTHCNKEKSNGNEKSSRNQPKKDDNAKELDEDLVDDCEVLQNALIEAEQKLSSFEEYQSEVTTGRLNWSPVHKSQRFWRENVHKFNENKYHLLVKLDAVLTSTESEPVQIQVACHDLGEYTRYYPRGKAVLEKLEIKSHIMRLLAHSDALVKYQALLAVQKIMVQNWEYLDKSNKVLGSEGIAVKN